MKRFHFPYATIILLFLGIFSFSISFAQPANNECSAAITLTSNTSCINTAGTNVNATWNPTTFPGTTIGCGATDKYDVWYRFVAQSSSQTITISSAPSQIRLQLLSGTCGSFTSIACGNTSITATGLTVGNTYYIRVYTQNSNTNTFNICVTHAPPPNDNCAGATSLTSNASCINTSSTLNSATVSGGTLGCFGAGTYYDVWFSFVAVTATQTITISNLGANLTNPRMQLYGGTCAGLANLTVCGTTSVTGSGLTVGTTYYVRVANFGSNPSGIGTVADFNICVTHIPPANDDCAGSISLTSGASCVNTTGTLAGSSYTTIASIGCGVANRNDVWYSFVAQTTNPTITISSGLANPRIQLFSGSCGSLASVACGTSSLTASGLTIGNTYFVRIYTDPNATGTFDICITDPIPPANNDCTDAVALTSGSNCINTAGTLANATYTSIAAIGCGVANRNDVWYSFVAQTTNPTITISSAFANPRIQLFSGTCASLTSVACGTSSLTASGLTIGNTYFIRIYTDPNASGVFNICVTDPIPPVNDNCAGAVALTSGTTCSYTGGTLTYATYTAIGAIGCGVTNRNDVWYSFVAQSVNPTITITSVLANPRIQLFSGGCGALASMACGTTSLTTPNLTIGNTYLVRVYTDPNVTGTFNICVTDPLPPANDDCAGAFSLASGLTCSNTAGTLNASTITIGLPAGCEAVGTHYDVWYRFVAVSATETITISGLGASITSSAIQLYSGICGALISLQCGTTTITTPGTLIVGTTYFVRVSNVGSNPSGTGTVANFNICVTHTGLVNNECAGAIAITSGFTCNTTAGTLVGSLYTPIPSPCGTGGGGGVKNDVWYSFVAQSTTPTITLATSVGQPRIQIYSGTCAGLINVDCGTPSPTFTPSGISIGTTYYVRVFSNNNSSGTFDICITDPTPPAPPSNDACSGAITLNSATTCVNTGGTLVNATYTTIPTIGCGVASRNDVWYNFVAQSINPTVTLSSAPANPRIQLFSGGCGALVSVACSAGVTLTASSLTIGNVYFVRIYTDPNVSGTFNICITDPMPPPPPPTPPANDDCSGVTILSASSTTCTNIGGTLLGATISSPSVPSTCGTPGADVWYSFVAQSPFPTISLSSIGASMSAATSYIQLLSGSCGAFTSIACVSSTAATLSLLPGGTGLTIGNTYYVRIYSPTTNPTTGTWTYNICITNPGTGVSPNVDYSKSYVNITKLSGGGGVEPGDVLEIRATFVVRNTGTIIDSLAFFDTLQANNGYRLISGTLSTQTNEGKVYKSFTDAYDSDAGWYTVSGSDTIIQMNLGPTASSAYRGSLSNTSRPSFYNNTCIIMATYKVQVYATYNQRINWGGGSFTYKDGANMKIVNFKNDSLVVYASPGLCSTALSANNQVGIETNGTFGTALSKDRGVSPAVLSYTYEIFNAGNPQDYEYGITNNTSGINTINQALAKPNANRVHNLWDITGDHTGATNTARGNPPCNTAAPISPTNPCGYMLVVNAAYKTDTAFRSPITNLCPNTYYEISAWVKNICYKCGVDSVGRNHSGAGYIPFAPNDTSGVPPNLAFQLNGQDYYQTGNIYYTGTGPGITQQASDTVNSWVKRGFVYKTGPTETGFELLIRNNAPGGGGNDWAIDDIVVATCSPEVTVTPGPNPFVCDSNTVDVGAIIASYYDNYTHYKFEESTDDGATWTSTGVTGSVTPTWNGSAWAYSVAYPTFIAYADDSGSQYRVVISSTAANLTNSSCSFSGGATVTLTVDPCNSLLDVDILSFKGRNENNEAVLYWTTSKEEEPVKYEIQKSKEGGRFVTIGEITGYKDPSAETNRYSFVDPDLLDNTISWYRIKAIKTQDNKSKYSKIIQLIGDKAGLQIESLINPFNSHVKFDLISGDDGLAQVEILDQYQHRLKSISYNLLKGRNRINIDNTDKLPAGFYILRVISDNNVIIRKIIKRG